MQLRIFEANKDRILEQQTGPIILEKRRSRSATVASRLKSLTAIIPAKSSKLQAFRDILGSKKWKAELEELQSAIAGLKPGIAWYRVADLMLLIIHQHIVMQDFGQTPLLDVHYPSRLRFLLVCGHDVCVRDKNGITPLMYAAAMNLSEAVKILIEHDADLFSRENLENYDFIIRKTPVFSLECVPAS
ncbi:hypothetical protein QQX98_006214 [Neonectria punicea]|uniref:Uncharacterized protein n=1 Tax=Neonectria punicea TaxID=979145 RepID=A0ABR1H1T3_9HYPO